MHARTLTEPRWTPLAHQVPPPGDWYGWLLLAGRGAGKTDACARYVHDHVHGPPCLPGPVPHWIGIIAPTLGDAATSCVTGPSGLIAHSPEARMVTVPGGTVVRWPNGSEAKLFGANTEADTDRLRSGGNRCISWLEEMAAWRYLDQAWAQMRFGLRTGPRPHWIASTTPKPRPLIKRLAAGEFRNVVLSRASMYDNPHLQEDIRQALEEEYGQTDLGRQELHAEILDEDSNALWSRAWLDSGRVPNLDAIPSRLLRTTIGVDPSGGAGEQGIVAVAKTIEEFLTPADKVLNLAHGYVLGDRTVHLKPEGWGRRAVEAAVEFEADDIAVEVNFGGEMAVSTIRAAADQMGINIPVKMIRATRGKAVRAQPVSALSSQNRWHIVGVQPELEDQLCVIAGTLVDTQRGPVPVEHLRPGDRALTRDGLAPIAWAGQTGMASRLTRVQVQGRVLYSTPWHRIYDPRQDRFVPALSVRRGSPLLVSNSPAGTGPWHGAAGGGAWRTTGTTGTELPGSSSIALSGRPTTGLSPLGISSITGTRTSGTTRSAILNSRPPGNTLLSTEVCGAPLLRTRPPGAGNALRNGLSGSRASGPVRSAETDFGAGPPRLATADDAAPVGLSTAVPVYDLMIAEGFNPEFYANGILVHNCTWYPELDWSPDRLDAMVWPAWHNRIVKLTATGQNTSGGMSSMTRSIG